MAAHRLRRDEKLLELQNAEGPTEGYRVRSLSGGVEHAQVLHDAPPGEFTGRWVEENGELRVAPMVDALLARMRRLRGR